MIAIYPSLSHYLLLLEATVECPLFLYPLRTMYGHAGSRCPDRARWMSNLKHSQVQSPGSDPLEVTEWRRGFAPALELHKFGKIHTPHVKI